MSTCTCGKKFPDWLSRPIRCSCGNIIDDGITGDIPVISKSTKKSKPTTMNLWRELHQFPIDNMNSWDEQLASKFFNLWEIRIPKYGCDCRNNWREYTKANPPNFESASEFLDWSIIAHDYVSANHVFPAKKPMGLEAGRKLWLSPKVVFISTTYKEIGETETFHRTLLPGICDKVNIIGFGCTSVDGGDIEALKVPYSFGFEECKKLVNKADIVVTGGVDRLEYLLKDCKAKVISVHHADITSNWSNNLILYHLDLIDESVCVNKEASEFIGEKANIPSHYIPNAIEPERYIPTESKNAFRTREKLPTERIVFWCARFSEEKQPLLAVKIAKKLPPGWVMVMAGDGPELEVCRNAAEGMTNIRFLGNIENPNNWLSISECFTSMSTFEGFGISMAEAVCAGIPVVATPHGIATDERIAIQVDAGASVDEWLSAIISEKDPERIKIAKKTYDEKYGLDKFFNQWMEILKL